MVAIDRVRCGCAFNRVNPKFTAPGGGTQGGKTALHWAAMQDCVEVVQMLLDVCPELAEVKEQVRGMTALQEAALHGSLEVVRLILDHRAELADDTSKVTGQPSQCVLMCCWRSGVGRHDSAPHSCVPWRRGYGSSAV